MMRRLLSKSSKRRLELFKLLYRSNDYLDSSEIAEELSSSIRLIKEDIDFLYHSPLNEFFTLKYSKSGYTIDLKDNIGPDKIIQEFFNDSIPFNILDRIFKSNSMTAEKLAAEFNTSVSTIYRELNKLKDVLNEQYNLKLHTKSIKISGNESSIRNLMLQYYVEKYSVLTWPFDSLDEKRFEEFIIYWTDYFRLTFEFSTLVNLKVMGAIALYRYKKGYRTRFENTIIDKNFKEAYEKMPNKNLYEQVLNTAITPELMNEIFSNFADDEFFLSYRDFLTTATENPDIARLYIKLTSAVESLSSKFQIPVKNKEDLIYNLYTTSKLGIQEINANVILNESRNSFINHISAYYSDFYKDTYETLQSYFDSFKPGYTKGELNHLIYTLFTHWENLMIELEKLNGKFTAVVISINDKYHSKMIKDILEVHLNNHIDVLTHHSSIIDEKMLEALDADFIISNFTLPEIPGKKMFYVSDIPTNREMQKIANAVHNMTMK